MAAASSLPSICGSKNRDRNIPVNIDLICHYRLISCNIFYNKSYWNSFTILRFFFHSKYFCFFIAFSNYFFSCFTDNFRNLTSI